MIIFNKIKGKLLAFGLCISLVPICIISIIYYLTAKEKLHVHQINELSAIAQSKKIHLLSLMEAKKGRTIDFSSDGFIRDRLEKINRGISSHDLLVKTLTRHLINNKKPLDSHIDGISVVTAKGKVIASTYKEWIGKDISGQEIFSEGIKLFPGNAYASLLRSSPYSNKKTLSISAPLTSRRSKNQEIIGLIINYYDTAILNTVTTDYEWLGKTGEVYLVNNDKVMVTESRFLDNTSMKQVVDTEPVREILEKGREITGVYLDYRGVPVVGASRYIKEYDWILLSEIDKAELLAPLGSLKVIALVTGAASGVSAIIFGVFFAVSVSHPINTLKMTTEAFASGKLSQRVSIKRNDEIGSLARSFNNMAQDIQEKNRALSESEERFRAIFDQAAVGVALMDTNTTKFLKVNKKYCNITGFSEKEMLSSTFQDITHPDDLQEDLENMEKLKKGEISEFSIDKRYLHKDGKIVWVNLTVSPMWKKGELPNFHVAIADDITKSKRTEEEKEKLKEQLIHSQRLETVGKLTSGVAHNFNNLLMAIMGYANLLKMDIEENTQCHVYIQNILLSLDKAADLTQSLLAFSRKQTINLQETDLSNIVNDTENILTGMVRENIHVEISTDGKNCYALADRAQIEQVLMNLYSNALDAMPEGGALHIKSERTELDCAFMKKQGLNKQSGEYIVVSVSDTGTGIEEKIKDRIFEPFFTTKVVGKGTGLGLSMVHGMVEQHGGFVTCSSEPGKGATFSIYLPLFKNKRKVVVKKEEREGAAEHAGSVSGKEIILLAEDEDDLRNVIGKYLEMYGYGVIAATDGEDAIKQYRKHKERINLAVIDVVMPKKNGKEVYETMKKEKKINTIFMSGYSEDILHNDGIIIEKGLHFIPKPVSPIDLLYKMRHILDESVNIT
ncbi:MAG: PAS domain S-box protein [Candidatus Kuenenia sp.]|nr:PAS domain S-box protein [Candidatus Kuenenia hertensis]